MNKLMHGVVSLRPFVPAKDFETSKRFYLDLGFSVLHEDAHVAGLGLGSHEFLLQNFYVKEFADNFMMHLMVDDADAWVGAHPGAGSSPEIRCFQPESSEGGTWKPEGFPSGRSFRRAVACDAAAIAGWEAVGSRRPGGDLG